MVFHTSPIHLIVSFWGENEQSNNKPSYTELSAQQSPNRVIN